MNIGCGFGGWQDLSPRTRVLRIRTAAWVIGAPEPRNTALRVAVGITSVPLGISAKTRFSLREKVYTFKEPEPESVGGRRAAWSRRHVLMVRHWCDESAARSSPIPQGVLRRGTQSQPSIRRFPRVDVGRWFCC